ncbi:hypothetical protein BXZ70DRAFT_391490 [Cristinia sonorae]|uniref:Uncharacterized protein n=1 Tax=Cristinia sonorae TaxID=1940300 RepID=A0A8K0UJ72_9AGAR|nr:hypothetical protein BXZ70DRAFT_391490 [Cristinia sonorae]
MRLVGVMRKRRSPHLVKARPKHCTIYPSPHPSPFLINNMSSSSLVFPHSVIMFPSKSTTTMPSESTPSPSSSPPKRAAKGVKKFVKGVKRRISLLGQRRRSSTGGESFTSDRPESVHSAHTPPEINSHSPSPCTVPLPPSPSSSSRTRRTFSDASSQASLPFSDSRTYASAEGSTLRSVSMSLHHHQKDVSETVEQVVVAPLSPIFDSEPVVVQVQPSESPKREVEALPRIESESEVLPEIVTNETVHEAVAEPTHSEQSHTQEEDAIPSSSPVVEEVPEPEPLLTEPPIPQELVSDAFPFAEEKKDSAEEVYDISASEPVLAESTLELPSLPTPSAPAPEPSAIPPDVLPLASPLLADQESTHSPPVPSEPSLPSTPFAFTLPKEDIVPLTLFISGHAVPAMFLPVRNVRVSISYSLTWWLRPQRTVLSHFLVRAR